MLEPTAIKNKITDAFSDVKFPGNWCLRGSNEGEEPYILEEEFKDKDNWKILDAEFIDQSPDGFGTALCFFSDEAFLFFLPAYLIADIDGKLKQQNPAFHLTHGLTDEMRYKRINPLRFGERTWFDNAIHKHAIFNHAQSSAIIEYLLFCAERDKYEYNNIQQALNSYWLKRSVRTSG